MGLMELLSIFGCPTRKSPPPTAAEKDGLVKKPPRDFVKDFRDRPAPKPLAKRTVKKFEGGGLSPNADVFQPDHILNPNEPEWAQFLAKKAFESRAQNQPGGPAKKPFAQAKEQPKAPAPVNFTLQTSEYLKLLNTDTSSSKLQAHKRPAPPGLESSNISPESIKMDLAGALDAIIRSQGDSKDKRKKPASLSQALSMDPKTGKRDAFAWLKDEGDANEVEAQMVTACDDVGVERQNRDQDLSELAYWSDDDQAAHLHTRLASHRASAHKIANKPLESHQIRGYVTQKVDSDLDHKVAMLLHHLRCLNDRLRSFEPKAAPEHDGRQVVPKRYVVGLKEVMRSIKNHKVKCIVIAPDIEEVVGDGSYTRLKDILTAAYDQDVPVIFSLSRVRMGRALGKFLRMSVLAIMDVKGCTNLYDSAIDLAYRKRIEWLAEQPKQPVTKPAAKETPKVKKSPAPGAKGRGKNRD